MNYIFCGAYRALFFALYLKNLGKPITIITYNKDIIKYCNAADIDYVDYELLRPNLMTFFMVGALRSRLDNLIEKIDFGKEDCFYLLGNAVAYEGFYLAKELSKKGVVYFKQVDVQWKKYKLNFNRVFLERSFIRLLYKLFLGLDLIFYETNRVPRYGINDKFLKRYGIIKIAQDQDINDLILEVVRKSEIGREEYENLVISDGPGIEAVAKYESIKNVYKTILNLPLEFAFKKHPDPIKAKYPIEVLYEELFKNCEEIPDYIPVELFFNNIKKNVISIGSVALITASKLKNLNAVSLLELVEWYHQSYKNEIKDFLVTASKNKILFPRSFEELRDIML